MQSPLSTLGLLTGSAEARRDNLARRMQWGIVAAIAMIVAPLAFTLLAAVTALLVAGSLAALAVAFAPVAAMKLANRRLASYLAEVRAHPMPTLENELLRRRTALGQAHGRLRTGLAQVAGFADQAEEAARRYPDSADRWRRNADKAQRLGEARVRAYRRASASVDEFDRVVERCRFEWQLAIAQIDIEGWLKGAEGDDPLGRLGVVKAIEAVTQQMNEAFAGLDLSLLEEPGDDREQKAAPRDGPPSLRRIERLPGDDGGRP